MKKQPIRELNESVRVIAEDKDSITMEIGEDCWLGCGKFAKSNIFGGEERCGTPNSHEKNNIFLCPKCREEEDNK